MATVQVSDELYAQVQQEAVRQGCSEADFVRYAIGSFLDRFTGPEPALTDEQMERMRESSAQAERGEVVSAEQVDLIFEKLFADLDAKHLNVRKNAA